LKGQIEIKNYFRFTNVNSYNGTWQLMQDDKLINSGILTSSDLNIPPLTSKTVTVNLGNPTLKTGAEYWLNLSFKLAKNEFWADAGHEIASAQFKIPYTVPESPAIDSLSIPNISVTESADSIIVKNVNLQLAFNKKTGTIGSYKYEGVKLLETGLVPNFWRAQNSNDQGNGMMSRCYTWRNASLNRTVSGITLKHISARQIQILVNFSYPTSTKSSGSVIYDVYGDGNIVVTFTLVPGSTQLPEIPEVGMLCQVPSEFNNVSWYGRGPYENYWDRKTGSNVGVYKTTVDSMFVSYIKPQETGERTDIRWVSLTNNSGKGLMAVSMPEMEFNALQYTPWELDSKAHPFELVKNNFTVLRLNYHQMGLGGQNSWGAKPRPEFTLYPNQAYTYRFRILPVLNSQNTMDLSKFFFSSNSVVKVPNLVGSNQSVSDSIIVLNGLTAGIVTKTISTTVPAGIVISQIPEAGVEVPLGTAVNLVISYRLVTNIALKKTARSDSEESSKGNIAGNGNDGDTLTRWCANNADLNHWWMVDLGSFYHLIGSEIMWEFDGQNYRYLIEVSKDDITWSTAVDKRSTTLTDQTQQDSFIANDARYVRITVTQLSPGCWASFWEFQVFTPPATTDVQQTEVKPTEYSLKQNFPNPFNPSTMISYSLKEKSKVELIVYDLLGRTVATLVNDIQDSGNYKFNFTANNLASGIYFYRLNAGSYVVSKKMILLK